MSACFTGEEREKARKAYVYSAIGFGLRYAHLEKSHVPTYSIDEMRIPILRKSCADVQFQRRALKGVGVFEIEEVDKLNPLSSVR